MAADEAGRGPPADQADAGRSKKQVGKRGRGRGGQQEIHVSEQHVDMVKLIRTERKTDYAEEDGPVQLSKTGKAPQLQLSEDRRSVTGHKGFRSVRATHGVHQGTWYVEVELTHMGATGHARVGWSSKKAELQAPVGYDEHGFAYRDLEGSKVRHGAREPYGEPFKQGDVVGMLIHLPEGGRPIEVRDKKIHRFKGSLFYEDEQEVAPEPLVGSSISFFVNGKPQGPAYTDFKEGTYYPTFSLFTLPEQTEGATLTVNFGPDFSFPPPASTLPPPLPFASVKQMAAEAAASAAEAAEAKAASTSASVAPLEAPAP
jgi:Set1/Ash2 histone methyltransferase complex subunit ASH2